MNKQDFVSIVAKKTGKTKKDILCFLESANDCLCEALARGEKVCVSGYGTLSLKIVPAMERFNPYTGKKYLCGQKFIPVFKADKKFRDSIY